MGTRVEMVLVGDDPALLRGAGDEAIEELLLWERRLSLFRRDSVVSQLNREAAERPVLVDREMFELLLVCRRLHALSGGAFDPAVGALMKRWGFRGDAGSGAGAFGMQHVRLDESRSTVRFDAPGLVLDLGGIGKGVALGQAALVLREAGVVSALLHAGTSTVVAIGAPPGRSAWEVGVALGDQNRVGSGGPVLRLRDQCLSVSAQRGRMSGGVGHVMDPRAGSPVPGGLTAAVVAPDAASADAWATALLVAGRRPAQMPADVLTMIVRPRGVAGRSPVSAAEQEVAG